MLRNQKARPGVWALVAGVLLLLSAPARAQTITATPQAVKMPAAQNQRSSVITWDAGANPKAQVRLKIDDGDETGFSDKAKGSQAVTIEQGKTYTFTLYKDGIAEDVLARVVVPGKKAATGEVNAANPPAVATALSFSGTWKTITNGTHQYTVILKQIGKAVTGSYSPGNGKIFDGVVTGNKLTFKWTQDGGNEGVAVFTVNEDGKGFTGTLSALKPSEFTVSWNTYTPPVTTFAGTWETISNGKDSISLTMMQVGDQVTGIYLSNGKIEGTVTGKVLRFKWESDRGTGSGRFVMDESAKVFSGTYNRGENPDDVDATWNGKRPAVTAEKAPEKVTPQPVSFTGVWNTMMVLNTALGTGKEIEVNLQQTGDKVTGTYMPGDGSIKDAVVTGRVLRFRWTRWEDGLTGSGRFEMGSDGKSISGSWNPSRDPDAAGTPWHGTLKPVSFTGVWRTMLATGKEIEVSLTQTGDKVTGTYMPGSADIKDGVVTDRVVRFQWTQNDGLSGSGRFQIFPHGNSIDGSWNPGSKDPDAAGTSWYGILEPLSFAGCWKLTGGMMPGETICLKQDNRGRVTYPEFEGSVAGNTMRFTHRPAGDDRSGRFILDKGGKSFHGFWHPGKDTELNENPCTGILVPTPPPATFAGAWRAQWGGAFMMLILQQTGDQVTGQFNVNSAELGVIREGIVVGNTLRFNVWRARPMLRDEYMGTGELVLDKGGKLFTGNLLGTATNDGTLIAR